jgi:ABC-type taurine transport system ATPase subunit
MTVREHLIFYARVKGIPTVSADVALVMEKIGLANYENRLASKLSGGIQRKLSLAIALLGSYPLHFLSLSVPDSFLFLPALGMCVDDVSVGKATPFSSFSTNRAPQ